jgi:hypothetical protein
VSKAKLTLGLGLANPSSSASNTFLFGANVRTQSGPGYFQIALQLISKSGKVLWQDVAGDTVGPENGAQAPESIYLSSKFISKRTDIPLTFLRTTNASRLSSSIAVGLGAKDDTPDKLRLLLIPGDEKTYFVLDAFLNKYPKPR